VGLGQSPGRGLSGMTENDFQHFNGLGITPDMRDNPSFPFEILLK